MRLKNEIDARLALQQLIQDRKEDYASLSRLIGRNPAYIQQFIKRGVPRKLDEEDRATLARYFGVAQSLLGGPPDDAARIIPSKQTNSAKQRNGFVFIPYLNVRASAGPGMLATDEEVSAQLGFHGDWLRKLAGSSPANLSIIRVRGDSMAPTLTDGDDILVDSGDAADRLRDGIYVLRADDLLSVKRIAMHPSGGFEVRSDNPAYPKWRDGDLEAITIIGRVIWAGRKIG